MATFTCEVMKIDGIIDHPNADRLKICKLRGYNCITSNLADGSPRYRPGDYVVYIPEASVIPDWILRKLGFWDDINGCGTLSGSGKNRVKIIKLRGEYSQGIMFPVVVIYTQDGEEYFVETPEGLKEVNYTSDGDVYNAAELLGITKYEPAIPQQMRGVVGALFGFTKSYDIDSFQKNDDVFEEGESVVITEKLHGTLCQIGFIKNLPEENQAAAIKVSPKTFAFATSKGLAKQGFVQQNTADNAENVYVKTLNEIFIKPLKALHIGMNFVENGGLDRLFIFGEICGPGIQSGFTYNKAAPEFRVFDVFIQINEDPDGGHWLDDDNLEAFLKKLDLVRVPVLFKGPWNRDLAQSFRDGKTIEGKASHIREGIVIRTSVEKEYRGLPDNRAQVKWVSPDYLMKSDEEEIG